MAVLNPEIQPEDVVERGAVKLGADLDLRLIGEILVERALVGAADVERALGLQSRAGGRIGALLVRTGALSEENLFDALSDQLDLPLIGKEVEWPNDEAIERALAAVGAELDWMLDRQVLLWLDSNGAEHCASRDPLEPSLQECLRFLFRDAPVRLCLARGQELERVLERLLQRRDSRLENETGDARQLRELAEEAPTVELVNNVMAQAVEQRASDIHIEPEADQFVVRFRIDGVLQSRLVLPRGRFNAVASRLKLISGMDIAERRLPQDGRFSARLGGQEMDIRISALPGVHGESLVMRLLPKERGEFGLDRLGLEADHLQMISGWMRHSHGIVLVTGPTGSGKSTTLYGALAASNDGQRKIITVEDPVEFQLPGITQIQAHAEIGLDFACVLRSILRQDPDVIMVGEIRDGETAQIAVQAALTGHLVLSTLHTNDALSAFTRLIDMGVEPYLVATPIKAVQAQRLVRRLCTCAKPAEVPGEIVAIAERWAQRTHPGSCGNWREPVGCAHCLGTGYRGRLGIYEMVEVSPEMQHLIVSGANLNAMRELAQREGARFLREDGLLKAWQGLTSVEEVFRVSSE